MATIPNYEALLDSASQDFQKQYLSLYTELRTHCSDQKLKEYIVLEDIQGIEECSKLFLVASSLFGAWLTSFREAARQLQAHIHAFKQSDSFTFDEYDDNAVATIKANQAWVDQVVDNNISQSLQAAIILTAALPIFDRINFVRASMGLSAHKVYQLNSYRSLVLARNKAALDRKFHDKILDSKVVKGLITPEQLRRAISHYALGSLTNLARHFGEIAASEAIYNAGELVVGQAIAAGVLKDDNIIREWHHRGDSKVRDSHRAMGGQRRSHGQPFLSGKGNLLDHPRDRSAPASDVDNCRCWMSYHFV